MVKPDSILDAASTSRIIEMAWDDGTPFEVILAQFGLNEAAVIAVMRRELKPSSYRLWRQRVQGRRSKHGVMGGLRHAERS